MRLSGWHVPIEHLSASSLAMLAECPERWRLRYLQKVPESTGFDKWIGIVDHNAHAENFTRKIHSGDDLPINEMHAVYDTVWDNEMSEVIDNEGVPEWASEGTEESRMHGHSIMATFHEVASPTINPIAVESHFEENLPDVPIKIIGYVDVEEQGRLIERKTTKQRASKPKPNWLLQGRLYSMVYAKPVEWMIVTRAKTPSLCLPEHEPGLRLDHAEPDSTLLFVQQVSFMLNDYYLRYGPDRPWPTLGVLHPYLCGYCFAGPKANLRCVAWKGADSDHAFAN